MSTNPNTPALVRASTQLSTFLGIEPGAMIETIKRQCFRNCNPDSVSDEQLAAFVAVANELKVNPLLPGMLYAYPDRGAIFPIIGPDGVYKRLSEHPDIDAWETVVFPEDAATPPTHATTKIYRKGRDVPVSYTAYLSEWKVGANPNWNTRPRHMLGLRSLKQAARQVIHGLPGDEDDRAMENVTADLPGGAEQEQRPAPPPREVKGAAAAKANVAKAAPAEKKVERAVAPVIEADFTETARTGGAQPEPEKKPDYEVGKTFTPPPGLDIKKPEPAAAPKPEPITALTAGQKITIEGCVVERFIAKVLNGKPSVEASITGPYVGTVYHLGGGVYKDAANPAAGIEAGSGWDLGTVTLSLMGAKLKDGSVKALVEKVELTSAAGETLE